MGRNTLEREQVYAVVRVDGPITDDVNIELRVTVKEVVRDFDIAKAEVDRLNELNRNKSCTYFWRTTRLFGPGESFGTHEHREPEGEQAD